MENTGPKGLPLLGAIFGVNAKIFSPDSNRHLLRWSKQYGPVFRVPLGLWGRTCVVVSDPQVAREILMAPDADVVKDSRICTAYDEVSRHI